MHNLIFRLLKRFNFAKYLMILWVLFFAANIFASPLNITYQARIVKPNGYPLQDPGIHFRFTILDPSEACVLYSENYSNINMQGSGGLISFSLGSGIPVFNASGTVLFSDVFNNASASLPCNDSSTYSPNSNDVRKIVMQFMDASGWQTLPAMAINAVPYAIYSFDAQRLGGVSAGAFVRQSMIPTCTASEAITYTNGSFSCVGAGSLSSITSTDVTNALGYTPIDESIVQTSFTTVVATVNDLTSSQTIITSTVNNLAASYTVLASTVGDLATSFSTVVSSQWVTSGSTINYTSGNVGIGTSAPVGRLNVVEANYANTPLFVRSNLPNDSTFAALRLKSVRSGQMGNGFGNFINFTVEDDDQVENQIGSVGAVRSGSDNSGDIVFINSVSGSFAERMRITSSGAVGIGTNSPLAKLEISGNVNPNAAVANFLQSGQNLISGQSLVTIDGSAQGPVAGANALRVKTFGGVSDFVISNSGNIGIGMIVPTSRLQIASGTSSLAPLKFTSGTLLSSPQSGTIEYDGSQLYFTDGTNTRRALASTNAPGSFENTSSISNSSGNIILSPNSAAGSVVVSAVTASTNSSTGALVVNGGLGVAGNINSNGNITALNFSGSSFTASSGIETPVIYGNTNLILNPSGGNVGIGVSSPQATLDVSGTIVLSSNGVSQTSSSVSQFYQKAGVGPTIAGFQYSVETGASGNRAERMRIDSSGNVGIGNSMPSELLVVGDDVGNLTGASKTFVLGDLSNDPRMYLARDINNFGSSFWDANNQSLTFDTKASGTTYARNLVLKQGRIGIGTNSPQEILHLFAGTGGNSKNTIKLGNGGWSSPSSVLSGNVSGTKLDLFTAGNQSNQIGMDSSGNLWFRTGGSQPSGFNFYTASNDTDDPTSKFIITNPGNIGIGTTVPTARLQIASGTSLLAPLKLTSGTLLSATQPGAIEYDGSQLYFTDGTSTRRALASTSTPGSFENTSSISNSSGSIVLLPNGTTGSVVVSATTASMNSSTGALIVNGGLGVAGNINSAGSVNAVSLTATSGITTPAIYGTTNLLLNPTVGSVVVGSSTVIGSSKLTVVEATNNNIMSIRGDNVNSADFDIYHMNNNLVRIGNRSGDFFTFVNGAERLRINSLGNIGIGTSSPAYALDILRTGSNGTTNLPAINLKSSNVSSFGPAVMLDATSNTGGRKYGLVAAGISDGNVGGAGNFGIYDYTSATTRLAISEEGRVGIGSTNLSGGSGNTLTDGMLQIEGGASSTLIHARGGGSDYAGFKLKVGAGNISGASDYYEFTMRPSYGTGVGTGADQALIHFNNSYNRSFVDIGLNPNGGRVGVGTNNPISALTVLGARQSASIKNTISTFDTQAFGVDVGAGIGMGGAINASGTLGHFGLIGARKENSTSDDFAGYLAFETRPTGGNLAERMRITSAGNVGIGTINPIQKLDINGITTFGSGNGYIRHDDTGWLHLQGGTSGTSISNTNNSVKLVSILENGNVGIGTSTPISKLHVSSDSTTGLTLTSNLADSNTNGAKLVFRGSIGGNSGQGAEIAALNETTFGRKGLAFFTSNTATDTYTPIERLRISNAGNVGIGTTNPGSKLEVNGDIRVGTGANYLYYNGAADVVFRFADRGSGGRALVHDAGNIETLNYGGDFTGGVQIQGPKLVVDGNLGVGTSAPTQKLHVVGDARIQGSVTDCYIGNGSAGTSCSSDERLKENIKPIPLALEKINSLRGVEFEWNALSKSFGRKDIGVIAQDVEKVFPTSVIDGDDGYKKVDYASLVAPLIEAVKALFKSDLEIQRKISSVEEKNQNLEKKINTLLDENSNQKVEIENLQQRLERLEKRLESKD